MEELPQNSAPSHQQLVRLRSSYDGCLKQRLTTDTHDQNYL